MSQISCIALFCESIREEKRGTDSLVGIISDNMGVTGFPGQLAMLAVYVRISFDPSNNPGEIQVSVIDVDDKLIAELTFERSLVEESIKETKLLGGPLVGLVGRIGLAHLTVLRPGRIRVIATVKGKQILCGALNFALLRATS